MRKVGQVLPAVLVVAALFGACTQPQGGGTSEPQEKPVSSVELKEIDDGVTSIDGDEAAAASEATKILFNRAPAVFIAPAGDRESQEVAASEAKRRGVPVLLAPDDASEAEKLADELRRLDATHVVSVGEMGDRLPEGSWQVIDYTDGLSDGELPEIEAASQPSEAITLALSDLELSAVAANIEAAGIPVVFLADPNLQRSPEAIEALSESQATSVLTVGEAFAQDPDIEWRIRAAQTGYQLPGGGQDILEGRQYVALYGSPGVPVLGTLGQQNLDDAITRVRELSSEYQELTDKEVVPSFEIIATVASGQAGSDTDYSNELPVEDLQPWVERAGEEGMMVILDLQPGRTDFLTQAKLYEELLKMPHVGLALDPEWRLESDEIHLEQIGSVTSKEINKVSEWLAQVVNENALPPKLLVLHQFRTSMITGRDELDLSHPEIAMLIHADGQGGQPQKQETWRALHVDAPKNIGWGWKNFIEMDSPMLTPEETMNDVDPVPDLVTYQ